MQLRTHVAHTFAVSAPTGTPRRIRSLDNTAVAQRLGLPPAEIGAPPAHNLSEYDFNSSVCEQTSLFNPGIDFAFVVPPMAPVPRITAAPPNRVVRSGES